MRRLSGILTTVATVTAMFLLAAGQSTTRGDTLWVANRDANTVTIVEAATGVTVRTLAIGSGPLHDIVIAPLTGKAYVMSELDDRVVVLSASWRCWGNLATPRPASRRAQ